MLMRMVMLGLNDLLKYNEGLRAFCGSVSLL